jgi:hypothetical protein
MRQNAGIIATLTVFLAVFGISNLPKGTPGSGVASETTAKPRASAKPNASKTPTEFPACEQIRKRLQPFLKQPLSGDWQVPNFCYPGNEPPKGLKSPSVPAGLHFVIATAPNPISTHLPLQFDRMIEVIQQAAQDDKYFYDSSWFPWDEVSKEYLTFGDQRAADEAQQIQEGQPGVVVFRRGVLAPGNDSTDDLPYEGGLVVFVVAEQPTGGIDRDEFHSALDWIHQLGALTPERGLKILGPTFSGSLPSLDQALTSAKLSQPAGAPQIHISVFSGSVSSELNYSWFKNRMKNNHSGTFQTAVEGNGLVLDRFLQYLGNQKYPLGCVAIISEDETVFGAKTNLKTKEDAVDDRGNRDTHCDQQANQKKHPIYLYYPRDIATLRSAYERQSIFSTGKQQSNSNAASTTLRGDLSEPNSSDHDTVRSYGGQLTPLAQESVLSSIADILKERRIQFVVLQSTNSLDQIFLTQFFRRAYPAARIVIDGSDLLFARGAEGSSLRGVMVLSTYPLLTWQQDWTSSVVSSKSGSYRIFGEDIAEGLYIAARESFDPQLKSDIFVGNYAPPAWSLASGENVDDQRPATWLSVIGRHQFWPVAAMHDPVQGSIVHPLPTSSQGDKPAPTDDERHPLRITTELIILLIACSVWSVLHFVWCSGGSIAPFPSSFHLAHFAPLPAKQHPVLIAFGSFLPAALAIVTAAASGLFDWSLNNWRGVFLSIWMALIVLISFLACWSNFRLAGVSGKPSAAWQKQVAIVALVAFAFFAWLHYGIIQKLTLENSIPAYWRSIHLLSGVSPLLPQVVLMAGMYLWFWFCLRGLAMFGEDRPLLPKLSALPIDPAGRSVMPMFSRTNAAEPIEDEAIPAGTHYMLRVPLTLAATGVVFGLILKDHALRTIGERKFGIMMFYWLSLCIAIILADTVQLWTTWRRLRLLLVYLDRLPLRRTLASLQGLSWGSVWAVSGSTLEERYRVTSRQFESLKHLENILKGRAQDNSAGENTVLDKIKECLEKGKCFAKWYVKPDNLFDNIRPLTEFQEEVAATAGSVLTNLLLPAWQRETDSLIFDRKRSDAKGDQEEEGGSWSPTIPASVENYVLAAEEFFVLPYLGFIQNILGRTRTIVLGSLFLFVAATFAVSSYPFDPLPVLGGVFLAVFAITGGNVVLVFAQMHRDATLSHITNTRPGELGGKFWMQLVTFGVGPLLGLLTTLFPSITDFVGSWLQPGMQALK